jgi:hypothetical protein
MACTESPCARTGRSHDRPHARSSGGLLGEGQGRTPEMYVSGKSDSSIRPTKPPNDPARGETNLRMPERARRWWRKGSWPRGTRPAKHAPDTEPEKEWALTGDTP